jgi:hypothetical protein
MTTLKLVASLPHGEANAAESTVFNLMIPAWKPIWITLDGTPDKLPPPYLLSDWRWSQANNFLEDIGDIEDDTA